MDYDILTTSMIYHFLYCAFTYPVFCVVAYVVFIFHINVEVIFDQLFGSAIPKVFIGILVLLPWIAGIAWITGGVILAHNSGIFVVREEMLANVNPENLRMFYTCAWGFGMAFMAYKGYSNQNERINQASAGYPK